MKQSYSIEIEAAPEQIWPILANLPGWSRWIAADGPFPAIGPVVQAGSDSWQVQAADGQRAIWWVVEQQPEDELILELERVENSPFPGHRQQYRLKLEPLAERLTMVHWLVEWDRPEVGWRELVVDLMLNSDFEEMLRISLINLATLVEESQDEKSK